jgi:hypothetical protein
VANHNHFYACSCDWERGERGDWHLTNFDLDCDLHAAIIDDEVSVDEDKFGEFFTYLPADIRDDTLSLEEALELAEQLAEEDEEAQERPEPERVYYDLTGATGDTEITPEALQEQDWEPTGEVTITKGTLNGIPACFVTWAGDGMDIYASWGSIKTADLYIEKALDGGVEAH